MSDATPRNPSLEERVLLYLNYLDKLTRCTAAAVSKTTGGQRIIYWAHLPSEQILLRSEDILTLTLSSLACGIYIQSGYSSADFANAGCFASCLARSSVPACWILKSSSYINNLAPWTFLVDAPPPSAGIASRFAVLGTVVLCYVCASGLFSVYLLEAAMMYGAVHLITSFSGRYSNKSAKSVDGSEPNVPVAEDSEPESVARSELDIFRERLLQVDSHLEKSEDELAELNERNASLAAELQAAKDNAKFQSELHSQDTTERIRLEAKVQSQEGLIASYAESLKQSAENNRILGDVLNAKEKEIKESAESSRDICDELDSKQQAIEDFATSSQELRAALAWTVDMKELMLKLWPIGCSDSLDESRERNRELQAKLDAKQEEIEESAESTQDLRAELAVKNTEIEESAEIIRDLRADLDTKQEEIKESAESIRDLRAELATEREEVEQSAGRNEGFRAKLAATQQKLQQFAEHNRILREELAAAQQKAEQFAEDNRVFRDELATKQERITTLNKSHYREEFLEEQLSKQFQETQNFAHRTHDLIQRFLNLRYIVADQNNMIANFKDNDATRVACIEQLRAEIRSYKYRNQLLCERVAHAEYQLEHHITALKDLGPRCEAAEMASRVKSYAIDTLEAGIAAVEKKQGELKDLLVRERAVNVANFEDDQIGCECDAVPSDDENTIPSDEDAVPSNADNYTSGEDAVPSGEDADLSSGEDVLQSDDEDNYESLARWSVAFEMGSDGELVELEECNEEDFDIVETTNWDNEHIEDIAAVRQ